jgi:hypothetical protein
MGKISHFLLTAVAGEGTAHVPGWSWFLRLLLAAWCGAAAAETQGQAGAVVHGYIQRAGGRLVADEYTATGFRRDDYGIVELTSESRRIPAVPGHGLHLAAVLCDMRPVALPDHRAVPRIHKRGRRLQYSELRKLHLFDYVYCPDQDYDLVPGQREIRVWDGNRILLREYFGVCGAVDCSRIDC